MASWDEAESKAEAHKKEAGIFCKLENDGDSVVGIFMGDPFVREQVWTGQTYEAFDPVKHKGEKVRLSFALNFYVPAEKQLKIIQGGVKWFDQVKKLRAKYGLDKWTFEITRSGAKGDAQTTYTILPDEMIPDSWKPSLDQLKLHDLAKVVGGGGSKVSGSQPAAAPPTHDEAEHKQSAPVEPAPPADEDDDLPF